MSRRTLKPHKRGQKKGQRVRKHAHGKQAVMYALEYYNRAFELFHKELTRSGYVISQVHPIRKRFWQFVPPGEHDLQAARSFLQTYLRALEGEMREMISKSSLAYWLHLYRRLSPRPTGEDTSPITIGFTRAVLESAIQKYARFDPCERIGVSKDVPIEQIFAGLLMTDEFERERKLLDVMGSQLVLTRFTHADLAEFYDLEKLAYETWRVGATLRSIAKGAPFVVEDTPAGFSDNRSDELADLFKHYDESRRRLDATATGVVFDPPSGGTQIGHILLPMYNLEAVTSESMKDVFKRAVKMEFIIPIAFNFLWIPFDLRRFREAHLPLGEAFKAKHGVSLDAVLAVIVSLCARAVVLWTEKGPEAFLRHWQRAYEGPVLRKEVQHEIRHFLPVALNILGVGDSAITDEELGLAIGFWELTVSNRDQSDLVYSGPHHVFLPYGQDRWFVDYAWIHRRLYDLFLGVSISDQNFKGLALETAVGQRSSVLPQGRCKALDGTERQINCAYSVGDHLVVVECKAVGRSIGYDRGDPEAILYRQKNVVDRGLNEADAKAVWIAERPTGRNYDISRFRDVLPIAVSPFVEFIPSKSSRYWISSDVARVLTPEGLREVLNNPGILENAMNRIPVVPARGELWNWERNGVMYIRAGEGIEGE